MQSKEDCENLIKKFRVIFVNKYTNKICSINDEKAEPRHHNGDRLHKVWREFFKECRKGIIGPKPLTNHHDIAALNAHLEGRRIKAIKEEFNARRWIEAAEADEFC